MNDRQMVEALFFPLLFKSVLSSVHPEKKQENAAAIAIFNEAMVDLLKHYEPRKGAAIWRRVIRAHDNALNPDRKGGLEVRKAAMMGYYVLNAALASEFLVLEEGSLIAAAIEAIITELASDFEEAKLDASARKQAAKMLRDLQAEGYFEGVEIEESP